MVSVQVAGAARRETAHADSALGLRDVYSTTVAVREAKVNLQHESREMDQSRQSAANPPLSGGVARPEASGPSAPTQLDAGVQFREVRPVYSTVPERLVLVEKPR